MTFESPTGGGGLGGRPAGTVSAPRRSRVLITTLVVLGAIVLGFVLFTSFYTDLLWYRSVDATSVFTTQLFTKVLLLALFGGAMSVIVGANMWIAYRVRPVFRLMSPEQASLERYRIALEPVRRLLLFGIPLVLGLLAGISATAEWRTWLMWRNSTSFGQSDPTFGMDVSFYVNTLPFLRFILGFLFAAVVLAFLASVAVHYVYGGIRLQPADDRISKAAQAHLGILIGIFVLLKAAGYWLDRYEVSLSTDDVVTGVTYKDMNALIPGQTILVWVSLICAILFFASAFLRGFTVAVTGLVLLIGSSLIIGTIYPAFVQAVQVKPTEVLRESPYIQNNINATRASYALDNVEVTPYAATDSPTSAGIAASAGTLENIRLLDPAIVSPTFKADQAIRNFYRFPDSLDVDRYKVNDKLRGTVLAVRELNLSGIGDNLRNWNNDHFVYTHGFGVVAAYDNTSVAGKPAYYEKDLPPTGPLDVAQPRIYFGEYSPTYSVVGAPSNTPPRELDYPADNTENGQVNYTYTGTGGVPVGSFFNRLLYSVKYQDASLLLSDLVNSESRLLDVRDPRDRVAKVAPWLEIDGDPYPAVVDGKVQWIVDGYTTTDAYPNATATSFGDATTDTLTQRAENVTSQARSSLNYIRNSVKATVDAYNGTVTLYAWDATDPLLQTWMKSFPGTVQPRSSMPADLVAHVRYPEDMFKVQRQIFARYHVTDPESFYSGQDFWNVPNDPTQSAAATFQPPYYLQVQMPGKSTPVFSLTTTFAPQKRDTLAAFMAVNSEAGPNYGRFQVLQLPSNTTIPGPRQVQNNFESDPTASQQLTLLRGQGSDVELGNLLSLPVGGGVLYVEPVYIRGRSTAGFPLLQKVLAGYGNKVAFRNTLGEALTQVFSGAGGTSIPGGGSTGGGGTGTPTPTPSGSGSLSAQQRLVAAIAAAQTAYENGRVALAKGDFAAYGVAQKQLEQALNDAAAAQQELGLTPTPTPTPSATAPTPSPSDSGSGSSA